MTEVKRAMLPQFISIGPVASRTFDASGRLEIPVDGVERGSWAGSSIDRHISSAATLALVMDVLDPTVDERVGAVHEFSLNSRIDDRGDLRGGNTPPVRYAYGALVTYPLDTELLLERAVIVHNRVPAGPGNDFTMLRYPRSGRFVGQFGPGASWYARGERDYFDQLLSFAGDGKHRDDRETERRRKHWAKRRAKWERAVSPAERALAGPWI